MKSNFFSQFFSHSFLTFHLCISFLLTNFFLHYFDVRCDLSESHRFSLLKETHNQLNSLEQTLRIDYFVSRDVPPEYQGRVDLIKFVLRQIQTQEPKKIQFEIQYPDTDYSAKGKADSLGLEPIPLYTQKNLSLEKKEIYSGLVVSLGTRTEILNEIFFAEEVERELIRILRKMLEQNLPSRIGVCIDTGTKKFPFPGEGSSVDTWGVFYHNSLLPEYGNTIHLELNQEPIPSEIEVLLLIGTPEFTKVGRERFLSFLDSGGKVLFLPETMMLFTKDRFWKTEDFLNQPLQALLSSRYPITKDLLSIFQIFPEPNLVFDPASHVALGENQKEYTWWVFQNNAQVFLPWVSGLRVNSIAGWEAEPFFVSSPYSGSREGVLSVRLTDSDLVLEESNAQERILGIRLVSQTPGYRGRGELLVINSLFFVSDILALPEFRNIYRDYNVRFLLNQLDLFLGVETYIPLRNKKTFLAEIEPMEGITQNFISNFHLLFFPITFILLAYYRFLKRNSRIERSGYDS